MEGSWAIEFEDIGVSIYIGVQLKGSQYWGSIESLIQREDIGVGLNIVIVTLIEVEDIGVGVGLNIMIVTLIEVEDIGVGLNVVIVTFSILQFWNKFG